jgi:SAM-dependent methyltransferase
MRLPWGLLLVKVALHVGYNHEVFGFQLHPLASTIIMSASRNNAVEFWSLQNHDDRPTANTTMDSIASSSMASFSRRQLFLASMYSHLAATTAAAETVCDASGSLLAEQAIPGAYEQACMNVPRRVIPVLQRTTTTTFRAVPLSLSQGTVRAGSTGLVVWNSSILLARLLQNLAVRDPTWLQSKENAAATRMLELGCGPGLVSMVGASLGLTSQVIATDGNPDVVQLAKENIRDNSQYYWNDTTVEAQELSWGPWDAVDFADSVDLLVGSDLTYNSNGWPALADTMATILKPNVGRVLYLSLGHSGFDVDAEIDGFVTMAESRGLQIVNAGIPSIHPYQSPEELLIEECMTPSERKVILNPNYLESNKSASHSGVRILLLRKPGLGQASGRVPLS